MEDIPKCQTGTAITIEAFKSRPCALPKTDPDYQHPTPEEVKSLRNLINLGQMGLAKFVGVCYQEKKGASTIVRRWEFPDDHPDSRTIDYAQWRLMLVAAGIVKMDEIEAEIQALQRRR